MNGIKILRSILLAAVGVITLYLGIIFFSADIGRCGSFKEYGGEAYTGIQNAEVYTGGLIVIQSQLIRDGISNIFIVGGLTMIVCAIPTDLKKKEN